LEKVVPSIRDVAESAGCSTSTVSRVINNRDAVDPQTRKKVLEAIDFLGYKPNLLAQGLRVKKGNLLGVVIPEDLEPFRSMIISSISSAQQHGFNVIVGCVNNDPEIEAQIIDDLIRRHINGIIFSRVSDESRVLHKVTTKDVPIVIIDRSFEREEIPSVILDNYEVGRIAAEHFISLHHREIGCVTGSRKIELVRERFQGFEDRLKESGITLPRENIFEGDFYFQAGIDAVDYFIGRSIFPTAIWALNDEMAYGVMKGLSRNGYSVPSDVSVMGMDDIDFSEMITPSLTTIHYPIEEMAEKAVDMIVALQAREGLETPLVKLQPKLVVRESTCPAKGESE
jgi:DNA-binding LacI/PurR family transcriptional regulator